MKSLTGINGGVAPQPPVAPESRAPAPEPETTSGQPASPPKGGDEVAPLTREAIEKAVAELQTSLDRIPGGSGREAKVLYNKEDRTFLVEIRDKETGEVIQSYPPENLLNPSHASADLLGTVVDRLS